MYRSLVEITADQWLFISFPKIGSPCNWKSRNSLRLLTRKMVIDATAWQIPYHTCTLINDVSDLLCLKKLCLVRKQSVNNVVTEWKDNI